MKTKIRILIVDDHFLVRIGLITSIHCDPNLAVVAEAGTAGQAIDLYRQHRPDIVLMDLRLPDMSGIEAISRLRGEFPDARVIVISSYDGDEDVYRAFQAGARGYLVKSVLEDELCRAIKTVHNGQKYIPEDMMRVLSMRAPGSELTQRELEVLQLMIKGLSKKELGEMLGVSENTVKFHVKNILVKLDACDRTEAITAAFHRGIIH